MNFVVLEFLHLLLRHLGLTGAGKESSVRKEKKKSSVLILPHVGLHSLKKSLAHKLRFLSAN